MKLCILVRRIKRLKSENIVVINTNTNSHVTKAIALFKCLSNYLDITPEYRVLRDNDLSLMLPINVS